MALYLRKVIHPQAHGNYRVILKCEDGEFEIGPIGIQHDGGWSWGIDTVVPMRPLETQGKGKDRALIGVQFNRFCRGGRFPRARTRSFRRGREDLLGTRPDQAVRSRASLY